MQSPDQFRRVSHRILKQTETSLSSSAFDR
jgi:hypothetical protein